MHFQEELWLWNRLETDIKADRLSWENLKLYGQLQKPAANFPISPPAHLFYFTHINLHINQWPKLALKLLHQEQKPNKCLGNPDKIHYFCAARSGCLMFHFMPLPCKKNIGWEIPPQKTPEDRSKCQKPESAEWWVEPYLSESYEAEGMHFFPQYLRLNDVQELG